MNKTIKSYLDNKIELNALIIEMKKHGTTNTTLTKFYCFDELSQEQEKKYRELKKHYIILIHIF